MTVGTKQLREFALVFGIGFIILIGFAIPLITGHNIRLWAICIGAFTLLIGIIQPRILKSPYIWWIKIGNVLGWINSHLILGLVYLIVLQPIALIMRLLGYDPLRLRSSKLKTYKQSRTLHKTDLTRIF